MRFKFHHTKRKKMRAVVDTCCRRIMISTLKDNLHLELELHLFNYLLAFWKTVYIFYLKETF